MQPWDVQIPAAGSDVPGSDLGRALCGSALSDAPAEARDPQPEDDLEHEGQHAHGGALVAGHDVDHSKHNADRSDDQSAEGEPHEQASRLGFKIPVGAGPVHCAHATPAQKTRFGPG